MASDAGFFVPTADRQRDLRNAFACFGTGVTVITTQTSDGPLGITANSFSSVSLDPPLVLWSSAVKAQRHGPFAAAATFCIHVLGADQLPLAHHFATKGDGFDTFDWCVGPLGAPRLLGCLTEFHCTTVAIHPAGDHSLILGEVKHVFHADTAAQGLLFKQGQFGRFVPDA